MTLLQIIGAIIVASPFVGIFAWSAYEEGVRFALTTFGAVVTLIAFMCLGSYLLFGQ